MKPLIEVNATSSKLILVFLELIINLLNSLKYVQVIVFAILKELRIAKKKLVFANVIIHIKEKVVPNVDLASFLIKRLKNVYLKESAKNKVELKIAMDMVHVIQMKKLVLLSAIVMMVLQTMEMIIALNALILFSVFQIVQLEHGLLSHPI